jgi:hypothetical protein
MRRCYWRKLSFETINADRSIAKSVYSSQVPENMIAIILSLPIYPTMARPVLLVKLGYLKLIGPFNVGMIITSAILADIN